MAKSKVTQGTRTPKKRAEKPVSEGIRRAAKRAGVKPRRVEKLETLSKRNERRGAKAQLFVARHSTPAVSQTELAMAEAGQLVERTRELSRLIEKGGDTSRYWREYSKIEKKRSFHTAVALRGTDREDRKACYHPTPGDAIRIALHGSDRFHPARIPEGTCANIAHEARLLMPAIKELVRCTRHCATFKIEEDTKLQQAILTAIDAMATRAELAHRLFSEIEAANIKVFTPREISELEAKTAGGAP